MIKSEIKKFKDEFDKLKPVKIRLDNERELNNKEAIWALFPALNRMSKRGFTTEEILEKLREKGIGVKAQTYRKYMSECRKAELQKAQAKAAKPKKVKPVVDEAMERDETVEVGIGNTSMPNYHTPAEAERKRWYQK